MRHRLIPVVAILASALVAGCDANRAKTAEQLSHLQLQNQQLLQETARQREEITELQQQLSVLRGFGSDRIKQLVTVDSVQLGRFTRSCDENKDGIDDVIKVYVIPKDAQHDTIKAAGRVTIELWDLAEEPARLIARQQHGPADITQYWLTGPMANHYRFLFDLDPDNPPQHDNATLKVRFDDALLGRSFELQKMITLHLGR